MKPYMLIQGVNTAVEAFEKKVAEALELGYSLAGELVAHPSSPGEVKFYQSMIMEDQEDLYDEDEEEDENEED